MARPAERAFGEQHHRLVRAIHACRRQVPGLESEDVWRATLFRLTCVSSLRQMNLLSLGQVLDELHRLGAPHTRPRLAEPHLRMARGLWIELFKAGVVRNGSDAALDAFARRVTKVGRLEWCGPDQANKVIEALKDWARRAGVLVAPP